MQKMTHRTGYKQKHTRTETNWLILPSNTHPDISCILQGKKRITITRNIPLNVLHTHTHIHTKIESETEQNVYAKHQTTLCRAAPC